jgi:saccharopine dehydrogenase (NAD+, L-lysine-forming)
MRIVVLGGAGIIGRVIALDLAQDDLDLVVADRDLAGAERTVKQVGRHAQAAQVDVTDVERCRSSSSASRSVQQHPVLLQPDVMRACLKAEVHYLDLGGLFHATRKQVRAR